MLDLRVFDHLGIAVNRAAPDVVLTEQGQPVLAGAVHQPATHAGVDFVAMGPTVSLIVQISEERLLD
ncbi:hypothetical protein D3C75_1118130 [compost metagenome]